MISSAIYVQCIYTQMYTEYITNFDNALKVLDESCKRNRAFEELVKEFEVYIILICCTHNMWLRSCVTESANLW